ncbi:hypothetical protein M2480_003194 [Parabacteroides sp. PFB2-12]|uniref:DNA/RNA non-specific endonuclease n=1 Tax=unclassified Parabacteroides TaxID=2649774 RepID=UPI002473744D|nr:MULTISPECIES: DNA/RNA non-specific endonuclease [unclassified Parabacteroides]MDH6344295.1 hypothetical protein [Parabacteroides sp. PM6-13]MDH6392186.1 hypothetical protein [Parabacteroides sp. PFB2-12]
MKNALIILLILLACVSCNKEEQENLPLFDFGKSEYEQPFVGLLKSEPSFLVKSLQYPPFKWLAPDTLMLEKSFVVDFNEEALRSKSQATISFVDSLYQPFEGLEFFCNGSPFVNNRYVINADSLTKTIDVQCKVHPRFNEQTANGFLVIHGEELDISNAIPLQQEYNVIADWQCEQKIGWPVTLWLLWLVVALLCLFFVIWLLYVLFKFFVVLFSSSTQTLSILQNSLVASSPEYFMRNKFEVKKLGRNKYDLNYPGSKSRITVDENGYHCKAGSTIEDGQMNEFLNNPLPSSIYIVDKYAKYTTDNMKRTTAVEADRTKLYGNNPIRNERNGVVQETVRTYGKKGDDGGHLISACTNGANEIINQVPMEHSFQANGKWRKFEEFEEKHIKNGDNVISKRKLYYMGKSRRPYMIKATAIINGKNKTKFFINP